ncbi:hypothetical protein [Spirosoma areae]
MMNINVFTLLDVAIALIFIFFVFSIFVSGIVELINTVLEQRAKLLRLALDKLLGTTIAGDFFSHKLTSVKEGKFWRVSKPITYLSADSFSTVLIDLLVKAGGPASRRLTATQQTMKSIQLALLKPKYQPINELIEPILAKSDDFQTFKAELEKWYNGYMEQVSGWFKQNALWVVRIVSALVALLLNVDTIHLASRIFNDNGLRERLVAEAINTTKTGGESFGKDTTFGKYLHSYDSTLVKPDSATSKTGNTDSLFVIKSNLTGADSLAVQSYYIKFVQSRIADLKLPIGWEWPTDKSSSLTWPKLQPGQSGLLALFGWLLTAAALSFGAPFWFDLLLKLVNIRNTARRPPGNPDPAK